MLPLSYLAIPPHLTLPDEITDQILTALTFLSRSRLANTISLCTSLLRTSVSNLAQVLLSPDQRLALYLILGAAYEDPGLVHHYRRKATWVYEEVVLALDATFHAAVPSNRRSVLVDHGPDTRYQGGDWGVDWGADGTDDDDARDLRDWVNDIGNLLNVLATYQTEVERHFALVLHAPVEAATGDRLRARQDCRARVVRGVGAWFGRIEAREKRVGFVLQEQLAWREEEIVDAYANDDLEHEALLDLPPNILASIDYQPQPSTETVWPTVLIGEEGNGEGYSLRTRGVQPDNKAIMDIEWPVATRDHAVKPYESHAQDDTRDNARVQGLGTSEDHQRPLILYNDPDIFHRARPSTAGKHLNKAESHRRDQPVWPNEWPLMGGQYQSPQSKYPVGETRGLSKWSLSEHNIPSDLLRHGEEHAVKTNLPFEYNKMPVIKEVDRPPATTLPVVNKDKALIRKPVMKNRNAATQSPNNNHTPSKSEGASSKGLEESSMKGPETQTPVKEPQEQPALVTTGIDEQDDKIVPDPFLVQSGIWKIL